MAEPLRISILSSDGSARRPVPDSRIGAYRATIDRVGGMAEWSLTLFAEPDDLGDLALIAYGDRVEAIDSNGVVRHRGYVEDIELTIGKPCAYTLSGGGVWAKVAKRALPGGKYSPGSAVDVATAWGAAAAAVITEVGIGSTWSDVGVTVEELDWEGKTLGALTEQLLKENALNLAVAGGRTDGVNDAVHFIPVDASLRYTIAVPGPNVTSAKARAMGGKGDVINRLDIRGGAPRYPNLYYNGSLERHVTIGATIKADGVRLVSSGGTVTSENWTNTAAWWERHCLKFSATATDSDTGDVEVSPERMLRVRPGQEFLFLFRVKSDSGNLPKLILQTDWFDAAGKYISSASSSQAAGGGFADWEEVSGATGAAPAAAEFALPRLRVRGNATAVYIDGLCFRDSLADAGSDSVFIPDGKFRALYRAGDSELAAGLSAAAQTSETDHGSRSRILPNDSVTTLATARQLATAYFNARAVAKASPSVTVAGDMTPYVPGDGVRLVGSFGTALMGGADFYPVARVAIEYGADRIYRQTLDLRFEDADGAQQQRAASKDAQERGRQAGDKPTAPAAGGAAPASAGERTGRSLLRLSPSPEGTAFPQNVTLDEYGVVTAATQTKIQDGHMDPEAAPAGYVPTSDGAGSVAYAAQTGGSPGGAPGVGGVGGTFSAGECPLTAGASGRISPPYGGAITAVKLVADAVGTCTITVSKATPAAMPSFTAIGTITLTADDYIRDTTLSGWTTAFSAHDVFQFVLTSTDGVLKAVTITLEAPATDS